MGHPPCQVWTILTEYCRVFDAVADMPTDHAFYCAYKYQHSYPKQDVIHELSCRNAEMFLSETAGRITKRYFKKCVLTALEVITEALTWAKPSIICWSERCEGDIGLWNHGAHFDDCFTVIWDGYPLPGWHPTEWEPDEGFGGIDLWAGMWTVRALAPSNIISWQVNTRIIAFVRTLVSDFMA